ncbi:signal peptidase I [Glycomyces xiaoerkulensis]|uniref:signal peptidase I n=1 Tax=Glycomyces xiaoerkulensis TaxID=2038139 RepID=UPI0012FFD7C9|nr:signal peptidase I [Glycomyces xiaoerkulensis]
MRPGPPDDGAPPERPRRRIDWGRLPGPGDPSAGAPPPPPPGRRPVRRGAPPPGRGPAGPRAGSPSERAPRVGDGRTGSRPQVTGSYDRVTGTHRQFAGRRPAPAGGEPPKKGPESRLSQPHKRHYLSLWVELPLLLVVAFSAAVLLRTFAVQPFYIPSGSMEQTLQEGDKVLVLKLTSVLRSPQRGEVVVFRGTDRWDPEYRPTGGGSLVSDFTTAVLDLVGLAEPDEKDFIKRVIAVGGDSVACCDDDGNVVVNGISLHEDEYVYDNAPMDVEPGSCHARRFEEVAVPEGHVWVMGDHRGNSQDSRCQGPVPVENIIGRAISLVWPTDRARNLEIPDSFDVLEDPADGRTEALPAPGSHAPFHGQLPPALPATVMGAPAVAARPRRLAP